MKLEEYLISKNIVDYSLNPFTIESVVVNKSNKHFEISIVFSYALNLKEYNAFFNAVNEGIFSAFKEKVTTDVIIGYKDEQLSNEAIDEYFNSVVNKLCTESMGYEAFLNVNKEINDNNITILVEKDLNLKGLEPFKNRLINGFEDYGLNINITIGIDESKTIKEVQQKIDDDFMTELQTSQQEAKDDKKKAEAFQTKRKYRYEVKQKSNIKEIPASYNALSMYMNQVGTPDFYIEGEVFNIEIRRLTKSTLVTIKVFDDSDSIMVKKWARSEDDIKRFESVANGDLLKIIGKAEYDEFAKTVVLSATTIEYLGKKKIQEVVDSSDEKRVELHCHTKMSNLDGITEAADYINQAVKWGHKAIAITDHSGVYSIPDIAHAIAGKDIKPIYGVELSFVNDEKYYISFNNKDIELKNATYVVFDLETTGFSETYDRIIEISAYKVYQGSIIDKFEVIVNPEREIGDNITKLTSISNEDVKGAPTIEECLPKFMEFCKDTILVAHNAIFDVGMIYANLKRLDIKYEDFPVIDTLNLFRVLHYNDLKKFNLAAMAKFYKVKQEHHHRACDDTRVTVECFLYLLQEIYSKKISNYSMINSLINKDVHWKYVIPNHLNILVKNQIGLKNMYKMLSDALTNHCYGEGRLLKSVLDTYREGVLVGSGCVNGIVFQTALDGTDEELENEMQYFDYIEVQPPRGYLHLYDQMINGEEIIINTIRKIINTAKKLGKIVVATSDCHYLRPSLKKYRDIMIASPQIGGGLHTLSKYNVAPDLHFRTTDEMLDEFSFLEKDLAKEIVVVNTNKIADSIDFVQAFHPEMFAPRDDQFKDSLGVPSIVEEVKRIVYSNVKKMYGDEPHQIVKKRIERELNSIISNGYSSVYYMSHLLVTKSLSDGYLVGSRGSVGSSLVATMMNITEINSLSPHYRCNKCHFQVFKMTDEEKKEFGVSDIEKTFMSILESVDTGYDLPDAFCPVCGEKLIKDGHDIPFETFLGFNGDKVPDIDLNFSGEYQSIAHEYVRTLMGSEHAFRSGTVASIADKNAYGYVKAYCEQKNLDLRTCEIDRIASKLVGIKRSTGQHPGGIIVVPEYVDIYDVTPVQYPADNTDNNWRTTHYDYHSFENNLLKLDILGHDDPTMIKYFMDYVHAHQDKFSFNTPQDIPIDDKNVYRLFGGTDVIGVTENQINSKVASYAVPEFGTDFVRKMLIDTLPQTFAQLVKISGLSHGTDVWLNNAQDLVLGKQPQFGKIDFAQIIGCRDDIMVDLLHMGLEPLKAFEIMEFVRKGKVAGNPDKWAKYKAYMIEKKVPDWYIWSCEQIKYMFPKAHATAYVMMALRIAWFKVYSPALFYSAWFSKRAKAYSVKAFLGGPLAIKAMIQELANKKDRTAKDDDLITSLQVALEMTSRKIKFLPVDIMKSEATIFGIEEEGLRLPFVAVDGLGENVGIDIVEKRKERAFTSKKDVAKRTRLNQKLFEEFDRMRSFGDLPEEDVEIGQGLFAFM